ncbi:MAG TPA: right-handed parallel beta-helix repeat-containing protein [Candidatus Binataceae bacterium]|nr:right-handed parallel beta-helix repeat-containing protein [Candidatus Binataceae bacterium]
MEIFARSHTTQRSIRVIAIAAIIAAMAARPAILRGQAIPIEQAPSQAANAGAAYSLKSGSYYLSRNIKISGGQKNGINVTGPNVSINFEGYSIIGQNSAGGIGINAPGQTGLTIQNGNIQGMGGGGVTVGAGSTVSSMHITGNGPGIVGGASCVIENNSVTANSGDGINAAGLIRGNVSDGNVGNGITAGANSSIIGNEASGNSGAGIAMQPSDGFSNNVINSAGTTVSGGVDAGSNVCNGSTSCP